MALADFYRKSAESITQKRQELAIERSQSSIKKLMESDQFRLSVLALPESDMAVDAIINTTVKSILDPVAQFVDTLKAKGFRPAEIRATVNNLYNMYIVAMGAEPAESLTYEDKVGPVADFVMTHQEVYNTLDPERLRG